MLISITIILFSGLALGQIMRKLRLPPLLGMLITGIVLGPSVLDLISVELLGNGTTILGIAPDIKEIALAIILLRSGLSLDIGSLKKIGRPALLMCFVPAVFEIVATTVLAHFLFGIPFLESAIMGTVLGAVSPAIVVPRMLHLIQTGHGTTKSIPAIIMAGSSADDVFVVVLFASFMSSFHNGGFAPLTLLKIPIAIILGIALGILVGILFVKAIKRIKVDTTVKTLFGLACVLGFVILEHKISSYVPISGFLAVIAFGCTVLKAHTSLASDMSDKLGHVWIFAEVLLFALVGASIDLDFALSSKALLALALLMMTLSIRAIGVMVCMLGTDLTFKERLFCVLSYLPKATVQAALGAIPMIEGVPSGSIILTVSAISILFTAPLGAFSIDLTYKKLLTSPYDNSLSHYLT